MGTIQIDGSTPKLTIGNATAEDATILFDGNAQDFYIALDDSADDLLIGLGSTVGTTPAIAIDENLKVNIPVTTASTSASTGSLTTGGGAGIGADLYVGDDAYLITDSAVLGFGADKDTTLTHTDGTGLTLNSTNKLCFNDASQFIQGSSATVLSIGATDEIDLTATAIDLNGTLDVSGAVLMTSLGVITAKDLGVGLHIRTSDSSADVNANADELVIERNGDCGMTILGSASSELTLAFGDSGDNDIGFIKYHHSHNTLYLGAGGTAMQTLTSGDTVFNEGGGDVNFRVETADKTHIIHCDGGTNHIGLGLAALSGVFVTVNDSVGITDNWMFDINNVHGTNPNGLIVNTGGSANDGNSQQFFACQDNTAMRLTIDVDGDVKNHDNSYGAISDERIKQNITDSGSQWDDIKAVKVRKFKKKDDIRQYGEDKAWEQIGVIAQELEAASMDKLVRENNPTKGDILSDSSFGTLVDDTDNPQFYQDGDTIPDGKKIGDEKLDGDGNVIYNKKVGEIKEKVKSVRYSIIYMKAIKALQEAQTRIETLETKVTALEG